MMKTPNCHHFWNTQALLTGLSAWNVWFLVGLALLTGQPVLAGFTEVASQYGVAGNSNINGSSHALWVDYDHDGDLDLLNTPHVNSSEEVILYRNDGNTFTDVTASVGLAGYTVAETLALGDYDNDGDTDFLVRNHLLRNDLNTAAGQFTWVGTYAVSTADYDNDGDLDLYGTGWGTPGFLYQNDSNDVFTEIAGAQGMTNESRHTRSFNWADYDGDGDIDLLVMNGRWEKAALYRNNAGLFTDVIDAVGLGSAGTTGYTDGAAWGDYDNDGDLDLYISAESGSANRIYRNDGDTFTDATQALGITFPTATHGSWGDYDNDGDLDLYVVTFRSDNRLYRNDLSSGGGFTDSGEMPDDSSLVRWGGAWGDFDLDGDLDYIVTGDGRNYLYQNDSSTNGNHWLHLNLIGTISNRSAIGATVHIRTDTTLQTRHIASYASHSTQNTFPLHFGVGQSTVIDTVTIKWPSGLEEVLENVVVDQMLTVIENTCPGQICHVSITGSDTTGNGSHALPFATIQHGINVAQTGYTVLVHAGTYVENINFNGKNLTVKSAEGAEKTVIDGNKDGSVVRFDNGETANAMLSGFSLTNGSGTYVNGTAYGGGIYVKDASPVIEDIIVFNNSGVNFGGGIYFRNSDTLLSDSIIRDNVSNDDGGGIASDGSDITIKNCLIVGNTAHDVGGAIAGAGIRIHGYGDPTIVNTTVADNYTPTATGGGGIAVYWNTSPTITNSIVYNNTGGEITARSNGIPTVTYSLVKGGYTGTGNLHADPLFVGGGDYHLAANSPAIDAGTQGGPTNDLDGNPRDSSPDMGAYEVENAPTCGAITDGLIAYYPLDGNADDASGNNLHGTERNVTSTQDRLGNQNSAYFFDGTSSDITAQVDINPSVMPQLTMTAWVRPDSIPDPDISWGRRQVISHDNYAHDRTLGMNLLNGQPTYMAYNGRTGGGTQLFRSDKIAEIGQWAFVAVVYDHAAASVKLYVDDTITTAQGTPGQGNNFIVIGASPYGNPYVERFHGAIDDVCIYNRALSDTEIKRLYQPKVDVWIADPSPDTGVEPNTVSPNYWSSPDIWVRNTADGLTGHQNVIAGQANYVYVRARNRGALTAHNTTIKLYRSKPSLANIWPSGWVEVGTATIDTLAPSATEVKPIRWDSADIPSPGHYCFYARLENTEDPLHVVEGRSSIMNTLNNNNIAWRNFNIINFLRQVTNQFTANVVNTELTAVAIDLVFEESDNLLNNDGVEFTVDLGVLFQSWQAAGAQGENITPLTGTTKVQLLTTPAKVLGIPMDANEVQPIQMRVDIIKPMPGQGTSREYYFSARQFINGELAGGVDYGIVARAQNTDSDSDGIKDINDMDNDNDGMPDEWEIQYGLNPLGEADAAEDADSDGVSNVEEYQQNTDPTTSNSTLYVATGTVKGYGGTPLANATVQIETKTVLTNATGRWEITGLIQGEYTVTVVKDGYTFTTQLLVIDGSVAEVNLDFIAESPGTLQFSQPTISASEADGTVTIPVTRINGSDGPASVAYSTDSANNTAQAAQDYTPANGTLTWTDGDSADKSFTVTLLNDNNREDAETLYLSLGNAGGATLGTPNTLALTINDDDSTRTTNISTRAHIAGGANDAYAGFIISGTGTLPVMLRGIAVGGDVDPVLTLLKRNGSSWDTVAVNDEWETDSRAAEVSALTTNLHLPDRNGNDAGLLRNLEAGVYTAILSSNAGTGLAVVGVDAVGESGAQLINISTRARISGGADDAYAGFIITGSGTQRVILRGIAVDSGVDPAITLLKFNGSNWDTIATNDEWETDSNAAAVSALAANLHLPDRNDNDAGMLRDLVPGVYTAVLSSNGNAGLAVVGVDKVQ